MGNCTRIDKLILHPERIAQLDMSDSMKPISMRMSNVEHIVEQSIEITVNYAFHC